MRSLYGSAYSYMEWGDSVSLPKFAGYAGQVLMAFYGLITLVQLVRYFSTAFKWRSGIWRAPRVIRERKKRHSWVYVLLEVAAAFVLSRLAILLVCYIYAAATGSAGGFLQSIPYRWCRWDADHYIGLIENW